MSLRWATKGAGAVLDQGLFAGSHLVLHLLLARWLSEAAYGSFAVAYSILILLGTAHTALLTEPMMVFGPRHDERGRLRDYLGTLLWANLAFGLVVAVLVGGAAVGAYSLGTGELAPLLVAFAIAGPLVFSGWLIRRAFYVRLKPAVSALGAGVYAVLLLVAVVALRVVESLSAATVLLAMGLAALVVSVGLLYGLQPRLRALSRPVIRRLVGRHWGYGRWSLGISALTWLPGNLYFLVLPLTMGMQGPAHFRAALNFVLPVQHVIGVLSLLLLPALAREVGSQRIGRARRLVRFSMTGFVTLAALYGVVLVLVGPELWQLVYPESYETSLGLLPLLALLPLPGVVTGVLGSVLRATERMRSLFGCYVVSALLSVGVGIPLALEFGVAGAIAGSFAASLGTAACMWWFARPVLREGAKGAPAAGATGPRITAGADAAGVTT